MATLAEGFPCSFLSCKANARVKPVKTGHGPHSSKFLCCSIYFFVLSYLFLCCSMYCFVSFTVLFVCICVLYDCHRVATQLQLTNISYHYFLNNVIEQKCVSGFSLQLQPKTFLILRINEQNIVINASQSSRHVKRRIKSHLLFAGIIRSSPFSPRQQDKG